jgi:hypothetical protein
MSIQMLMAFDKKKTTIQLMTLKLMTFEKYLRRLKRFNSTTQDNIRIFILMAIKKKKLKT